MFLILRCSYLASLNDMFRPFKGPSWGWSLFLSKANHTISNAMLLLSTNLVDNKNIALLIVWCDLQRKKVINLKMARGRDETCRWEKLCKNILVIKTLKSCVWLYFTYIFCVSRCAAQNIGKTGLSFGQRVTVGDPIECLQINLNTLRTGLLNCLNARSRGLTFRHRASCI